MIHQGSVAVILAGGKSIRMGFDKQFIMFNDNYLIKENVKKLSKLFDEIIIISNNSVLSKISFEENVSIFEDDIKNCGPLGGIYTALNRSNSDMIYVIACDMPEINELYIEHMKDMLKEKKLSQGIVTRFGDWIEPFNAFYSKRLTKDIKRYLLSGRRSIYGFIKTKKFEYVEEEIARKFSPNWEMFSNFNTTDDLINPNII